MTTPPSAPKKNSLWILEDIFIFYLLSLKKQSSVSFLGHKRKAAVCVCGFYAPLSPGIAWFPPPTLKFLSLGQVKQGHMTMPGLTPFT